jgi:hypothetical protein
MRSSFGGNKQSGFGREKDLVAFDNRTQIKNVVVRVRYRPPGDSGRGGVNPPKP